MPPKKPWRKVLYERQPYPDNYTDKSIFLQDLQKNIHFEEVSLTSAIFGASVLVQQICTVVGFVLIYIYLINGWIKPSTILNYTSGLTIIAFCVYLLVLAENTKEKILQHVGTVLNFIVFGQLFSPVLHTLTDTIDTDSIYNMSFIMMLVHLIFFDYGVGSEVASNSLSLNAAIFASICLASRLPSAHQAFILMTIATESFVLFPIFRNAFKNSSFITAILFICDTYFLYNTSCLLTIIFVLAIIFINLVCPALFVHYQKYKENIYGPWDEAVVDEAEKLL